MEKRNPFRFNIGMMELTKRMKVSMLHLEVLEMMERLRTKMEFYYGVRVRKSQHAIDGYVFLGNEDYIWVPVCPVSIPENKTRAIGVVFRVKGGELTEAWIEFVIPGPRSRIGAQAPGVAPVLRKTLPPGTRNNRMKWYDRSKYLLTGNAQTTAAVIQQTENSLIAHLSPILKVLGASRTKFPRFPLSYDKSMMKDDIVKLLTARSGIADATNKRLMSIRNGL